MRRRTKARAERRLEGWCSRPAPADEYSDLLAEIVRMAQKEHQCLDRYIEGLTMLSKTDIHSRHEAEAFCAFYFSLKEATQTFGDCTDRAEFPKCLSPSWRPHSPRPKRVRSSCRLAL